MLFFELGSSPIDVVDPSWELYVLIQRKTDQQGEIYNMLLGFTAVYRFHHYPVVLGCGLVRFAPCIYQLLVMHTLEKQLGASMVQINSFFVQSWCC